MFDRLKQMWLKALGNPATAPQYALLLTETKSPWGWRESLQPRVENHATDGADVVLIGPSASGSGNRKLSPSSQDVLIIEQLDYWYEEASGGTITDAINAAKLELAHGRAGGEDLDHRLPPFLLNHFARGDSVLRFGKLPLGWILSRETSAKLTLKPGTTAGGNFNLYADLLVRREPLWLMEAAGLLESSSPGGRGSRSGGKRGA